METMNLNTEISQEDLVKQANEGVEITTLVLQKLYYGKEEVIGYGELNERIVNYLCNSIGDDNFQKLQ